MVKAVIFDMDGLMIDSERVTFEGYVEEYRKLGKVCTEEFYLTLLGKRVPEIYERNYREFGREIDMDRIIGNVHRYMEERFRTEGVPVKKGLRELLEYLRANGIAAVVATSSARGRVDRILSMAGLAEYFAASVCGDEVSRGKPDPETFLTACQKAGASPEEALVLEDSEAGIQAAHAGHIPVICVPDMKIPEERYAAMTARIVNSLLDVIPYLEER